MQMMVVVVQRAQAIRLMHDPQVTWEKCAAKLLVATIFWKTCNL